MPSALLFSGVSAHCLPGIRLMKGGEHLSERGLRGLVVELLGLLR
jgi:hypothetical protein